MALILRLIVNAVALWVATLIVPGISLYETAGDAGIDAGAIDNEVSVPTIAALLIVAVVFTLINAVIKPIVQLLSLPLLVLTLGLFTLVINALMLLLTAWITESTSLGISVAGFWTAVWGALIISVVNFVLIAIVPIAKR